MSKNRGWSPYDQQRHEQAVRAMTIANGSSIVQNIISKIVAQLTFRILGVQSVLPVKPGSGSKAQIPRRAAGSTGGAWVADTTAATEETGTRTLAEFTYKTALTRGKVTRKQQAVAASWGDALADEMEAKAEDFADLIESGLVTGDSGSDANEPDGLLTLIGQTASQVVANTSAAAGDDPTAALLDETIDTVKGSNQKENIVIFVSQAGGRQINAIAESKQRFNQDIEVAAGFRVRSYDGYPVVTTTQMPDTVTWSGSAITSFTTGATTAIAVVNMRHMFIEDLTPTTVMPLAKDSSQYDQFDIFRDLALVLRNTLGASFLGGVTTS